jgi:hypothetical protein
VRGAFDRVEIPSHRSWLPAAVCVLLTVVHTWPLVTEPGTLCRNDNGDALLNEWILAWVAHQLPRDPIGLFDANIFHPARNTLAYSEPLIVPALLGAPATWLGGSPVLVFNIVLLLGFALTAWAGYALVVAWTGDRFAGLLTGSTFAFNTHVLTRLAHVQAIHAWGLPLALLAADRLIRSARLRDAVWLSIWMAAMAATSGYLAVFAVVMIGTVLVSRVTEWFPRAATVLGRFALAGVLTAAVTLPITLPYRQVATEQQMTRTLDNVADYSATPRAYVASAGRLHYATWSEGFFRSSDDAFFPGLVVLCLGVLAVASARPRSVARDGDAAERALLRQRVIMLSSIVVVGFVLSLGTHTPVYGWLYHLFPPMQALRAAARFGNLVLLGLAALAGLGLASVRRGNGPRLATGLGVALLVLANLEALRAPLHFTRFVGIPSIYSLLADEPGHVVLAEVPFYPAHAIFQNAPYVLNSTAHWRPLMNGYSGHTPASYREFAAEFEHFPGDQAVQAMRRAGVTHVMIHVDRYPQGPDEVWNAMNASPFLERVAVWRGTIALYRLH